MGGRLLVVAYFFPPLGGVGVLRTLKYVKYLPHSGWQPIVITPAKPAHTVRDAALLDEMPPDLRVERTASFEPTRLSNAVASRLSRSRSSPSSSSNGATAGPPRAGLAGRLLLKCAIAWGRLWGALLFPDAAVGWVGAATKRGLAVHKTTPVDAIYSSSGPISCHLIASRIAARTGLPWIADFRDPWIGNAFAAPARGLQAIRQRRMERRIVEGADMLIFPTPGVAEAYAARYPWAAAKMRLIPNGYDRADFRAPGGASRDGDGAGGESGPAPGGQSSGRRFRVVYTGSLYGEHDLEIFMHGLETLVERRPEVAERLEVEFVGRLSPDNRDVAASYARLERLGSMVRFSGLVPHAEAMRRAATADALLQFVADGPRKGEIQGGKLMEYLGYDRQILALVPEGSARQVLRELDWGIIADPTPEGVASGLEKLLDTPLPTRRADPEGRYDRANLAARLAVCLDEVTASKPT
jgi:glycosyltransferase involved in cell wall biosynthesis